MPHAFAAVLVVSMTALLAGSVEAQIYVPGHTRSDGLYIRPHFSPGPLPQPLEPASFGDGVAAGHLRSKALDLGPRAPDRKPAPPRRGHRL